MKPAYLPEPFSRPQAWEQLPGGGAIQDKLQAIADKVCRQFFGYHILQLGQLSCQLELSECPIKHKVKQSAMPDAAEGLISNAESLPFKENSIDAVVSALELDFSRDPHQILREIDRIMIPEGKLMLIGFNPLSIYNLARFAPGSKRGLVRSARFFSCARVCDWLSLLGYEICSTQKVVQGSFLLNRQYLHARWLPTWLQKWLPNLGAVYVIVAKKRVSTLTPMKPKWHTKPKLASVVGLSAAQGSYPAKYQSRPTKDWNR